MSIIKEVLKVDPVTQEILEIDQTFIRNVSYDKFIQVYLEDITGILKISSKGELQVLGELWKISQVTEEEDIGNKIVVEGDMLDKISTKLGTSVPTVRNLISRLKFKGLLIPHKKRRGIYYLNPQYFFKGELKDRIKKVKLSLEYQITE